MRREPFLGDASATASPPAVPEKESGPLFVWRAGGVSPLRALRGLTPPARRALQPPRNDQNAERGMRAFSHPPFYVPRLAGGLLLLDFLHQGGVVVAAALAGLLAVGGVRV